MTSRLFKMAARSIVANADLGVTAVFVLPEGERAVRVVDVEREQVDRDDGSISITRVLRVPRASLPAIPVQGDEIRIGAEVLFVAYALERRTFYEIAVTLNRWGS